MFFSLFRSNSFATRRASLRISRRCFTTAFEPIDLQHDVFNGNGTKQPLVILHGFFGSKRNWGSLSKAFARDLDRPVFALDLRNHGMSAHAEPMHYSAMAADVLHFCQKHSLTEISLMGHSMGGKVAMSCALSPELPGDLISQLIVADIAPAKAQMSSESQTHLTAMHEINTSKVTTRKEAEAILSIYEKDPSVRAFILTNMITPSVGGPEHASFRLPLDILRNAIPNIGSFPHDAGARTWDGKTLIIKGTKSKFINRHNIHLFKEFFPNHEIQELDAGHWVHAEQPTAFRHMVTEFIKRD